MQRQVVEKDVDRDAVPEKALLAVPLDGRDISLGDPDPVGARAQDSRRIPRVAKNVDVEVASPSRLLDAIGESDRAAEGMRQGRRREGVVNGKELFDQLTHAALKRSAKGGNDISDRGRNGNASANSR